LHLGEGHCCLRCRPELHDAPHVERRHDGHGHDLRQIPEPREKEPHGPADFNDHEKVIDEALQPATEAALLFLLAAYLRDRFGVFPQAAEPIAEVGFFLELLIIEIDESATQQDRTHAANHRINERREEKPGSDQPQDPGERNQGQHAVDEHHQDGERRGGKGLDVLADALVGIVDVVPFSQAEIGAVRQVTVEAPAGQPLSPHQPQPLLGVAGEHLHHGGDGKDPGKNTREEEELRRLAVGQRGHEVAAHIAVDHVHPVDHQQ
jgi:hypothetical protein